MEAVIVSLIHELLADAYFCGSSRLVERHFYIYLLFLADFKGTLWCHEFELTYSILW